MVMRNDLALIVHDLSWQYGAQPSPFQIRGLSLELSDRECLVLLGSSGCGKTTILKLIAGLLPPMSGQIRLLGSDIAHVAPERRGIGMIFQQPLLFPHMTVAENVAFPLKMQGVNRKERQLLAREWLAQVGLADVEERMPHTLSGGQQQRVSLARAFAQRPKLMLMDEPFSALDPISRAEMRELFRTIRKQHTLPTLFVTHDREEAFELSDRIAVISDGRIEQLGRSHELYDYPKTLHVAQLLGIANVFRCKDSDGCIELPVPWQQSIPPLQGDGLLLRPEWITLEPWRDSPTVQPQVKGRIINLKHRPGMINGTVKLSEGQLAIEVTYNPLHSFRIGDEVAIHVDPRGWRFISTE